MKRPQPSLEEMAKSDFIMSAGFNRKFKRLWGTTTVGGIEVLKNRLYYFGEDSPDIAAQHEKAFKFIKVWNDVKDAKPEGIKHAWIGLSKNKGVLDSDVDAEFVANNLNKLWVTEGSGVNPQDVKLTTSIVISSSIYKAELPDIIAFSASKEVIADVVLNNYEALWENNTVVQEGLGILSNGVVIDKNLKVPVEGKSLLSVDDPWLSALSRYALRDSGVACTIKSVDVGIASLGHNVTNTAVVTLEIPYTPLNPDSPIVQEILEDLLGKVVVKKERIFNSVYAHYADKPNRQESKRVVKADFDLDEVSYDDEGNPVEPRNYVKFDDVTGAAGTFGGIWVKHGKSHYLKAEVIDDPRKFGISHYELKLYLTSLIDSGYKKKSVPLWKKVVAVAVFIVAVVVTFISGGSGLGPMAKLTLAAWSVIVGSLAVTLFVVAFSAFGMAEMSMAFAWLSKEIEPLVTIASVVLVVDAITNLVQKGIEEGFYEMFADMANGAVKDVLKGVTDVFSGNMLTEAAISTTTSVLKLFTRVTNNKLESLNDRNNDLKTQYKDLQKETEQESDVMRGFMNVYAKPATADWSMYATVFDLPYERGGGIMALGNVQKTTKQALRAADYKEPMFKGILIV